MLGGATAVADASALICCRSAPNTASIVAGVAAVVGAVAEVTAVTVVTSTKREGPRELRRV
ncbi:hypothetical protein GCM10008942_25110 [Rhizomicrobium electricum]|uniref:Uncharacterized protein n=1 Tax=Rhizomicrobium electricum TaxID=480070 RepID=A0ABP3PXV3_9PROT